VVVANLSLTSFPPFLNSSFFPWPLSKNGKGRNTLCPNAPKKNGKETEEEDEEEDDEEDG